MEFNEFHHSFHSLRFSSFCDWRHNLRNCDDAPTLKTLLLIATIITFIISLLTLTILCWKLNYRSSTCNKSWKIYEWSSIELILFWITIYCLFRGLHTFTIALDLFTNHVILRASFYEISFIPGFYLVLIYLTNIFRLIPKLSFNQTSNRKSNIKTICIPKDKQSTIIFWFSCIFTTLSLTCSSIIRGYSIIYPKKSFFIITTLLDTINLIIRLFLGFCLIYYGRISVNLTNQSMILAGIDDIKDINNCDSNSNLNMNHTNILNKLHVHKMQIFNIICGITFIFYSFINIVQMIFFKDLIHNPYFEMFDFSTLIFGTPLFTLILVIAILLPNVLKKKRMLYYLFKKVNYGKIL
ncbi:hypothetical protein RhiirA1_530183 [Rhizophagus irregularis]|uniref:Uncharacterized protein n=1 Tax=Rhizophagus irregularis TaxID=588596 RepID=A0A2N0SDS6_9GLOM|nr:hypothetical protein RhiirA1_530183 [Rhizophagus irregularis]